MNLQKNKTVFVTVGTTEFEQLIQAIDDPQIYLIFQNYGYSKFTFQIGKGKYKPKNFNGVDVSCFDLKSSLKEDYVNADLVISHCGAGTLLECLQLQKKIIAVINDTLMDNHQMELFDALKEQKYIQGIESASIFKTKVNVTHINIKIESILKIFDSELKKYPQPEYNLIDKIISQTVF